jgi:ATP-binding cassette subfamily F protein 2
MTNELVPTKGAIRPHPHLRIARYTQHYVDTLDLTMNPLDFFCSLLKDEPLEEVRKRLGRFGVTGDSQTTKMAWLSDGMKSRIVFARMALQSPHLLLLDEPTNGLSMEAIDSLAEAIKLFQGGVVLVSHDMRLISQVAEDIYECADMKVSKFQGDILAYKTKLKAALDKAAQDFEKDRKAKAASGKL